MVTVSKKLETSFQMPVPSPKQHLLQSSQRVQNTVTGLLYRLIIKDTDEWMHKARQVRRDTRHSPFLGPHHPGTSVKLSPLIFWVYETVLIWYDWLNQWPMVINSVFPKHLEKAMLQSCLDHSRPTPILRLNNSLAYK